MSAWQWNLAVGSVGLVLAATFAGVMLWLWRRQPVTSYRLVVIVLFATLVLPLGQFVAQATGLARWLPHDNALSRFASALVVEPARENLATSDMVEQSGMLVADVAPESVAWTDEDTLLLVNLVALSNENGQVDDFLAVGTMLPSAGSEALSDIGAPDESDGGFSLSSENASGLLALAASIYIVGLVFSLGRLGLRVRRATTLLRNSRPVVDREILSVWSMLVKASPLRDRVELRMSDEIQSPMCFGLTTPIVVLPTADEPKLAREVLSCVLLHELVHLERGDTWTMLGQEAMRSFFWFHPAAWWLCKRIDMLRELSCDLLVVRRTGRRKRYASALVEYAAWMRRGIGVSQTVPSTALLPWTTTNSQLARRIEMLVSLSSVRRGSRRSTIFAASAAFSALWGGQLALAAANPGQDEDQDGHSCAECTVSVEVPEPIVDVDLAEILEIVEGIEIPDLEPLPELTLESIDLEPLEYLELEPQELHVIEGTNLALGQTGITLTDEAPLAFSVGTGSGLAYVVDSQDDTPIIGVQISSSSDGRIVVHGVNANSIAERAGIEPKDVIVSINGKKATLDELSRAKREMKSGSLNLGIERDDAKVDVMIRGAKFDKNKNKVKADKGKSKDKCKDCEQSSRSFTWATSKDSDEAHGSNHFEWNVDSGQGNVLYIDTDEDDDAKPHRYLRIGDEMHLYSVDQDDEHAHGKVYRALESNDKRVKKHLAEIKTKVHELKQRHKYEGSDQDAHANALRLYRESLGEGHAKPRVIDIQELKEQGIIRERTLSDAKKHLEHALHGEHNQRLDEMRVKIEHMPREARERLHEAFGRVRSDDDHGHAHGEGESHGSAGGVYRLRRDEGGNKKLEAEIDALRAKMKEREHELQKLRNKLEKLRNAEKGSHGEMHERSNEHKDDRHFEWRRSEDQATLVPTPATLPTIAATAPAFPAASPSTLTTRLPAGIMLRVDTAPVAAPSLPAMVTAPAPATQPTQPVLRSSVARPLR